MRCTAATTALAGAAHASSCLQTNFAALLDLNLGWVELWWEQTVSKFRFIFTHNTEIFPCYKASMHSGPPGGGLRFWGKIFRVPFFGSFGFPTCQMIRKKYSNIRGKPFPV